MSEESLIAIGLCAVVTYALRCGGLILASKMVGKGAFKVFMDTLPGAILVALVAPSIFSSGLLGFVATLATAATAVKTKNVFLAMLVGIIVVAGGKFLYG